MPSATLPRWISAMPSMPLAGMKLALCFKAFTRLVVGATRIAQQILQGQGLDMARAK